MSELSGVVKVIEMTDSTFYATSSEDYIQTLGVNFMEKTVSIRNTEITFSVSDICDNA